MTAIHFIIGITYLIVGYFVVSKKIIPGNDSILKLGFRALLGLCFWPFLLFTKQN